jgi:hypothetical protein
VNSAQAQWHGSWPVSQQSARLDVFALGLVSGGYWWRGSAHRDAAGTAGVLASPQAWWVNR